MPCYSFWHIIYSGELKFRPMINELEDLKNKSENFWEDQPNYSQKPIRKLEVTQEDEHNITVIYGDNLWVGIAGLGAIPNRLTMIL